jgi:Lrp/AsnC family transcriptional regulator, leucine-responsive regulatory protein
VENFAVSDLDIFDEKLLAAVQKNARIPAEELGAAVGLSGSAVLRRLKHLREIGVIDREVAVVRPEKLGPCLRIIAGVELERERPDQLGSLIEWLTARDEIQQAYYISGTADLLLIIIVPDVSIYDTLTSELVAEHPTIKRITTSVVFRELKTSLVVPI